MAWTCVIQPHRLSEGVVLALCEALVKIDLDYLRETPATPRLYESGVRYRREPPGAERWAGIGEVLELGHGDCEDLACWRVAELVHRGHEAATPLVRGRLIPGEGWLYHILVQRADGTIEDPSKLLGM